MGSRNGSNVRAMRTRFPPGRKMGSRNGLNVRTMRTRFPPGRKGGEHQQENSLRLGLGLRSQGCARLLRRGRRARIGHIRTVESAGLLWPTEWFRGGQQSGWRRGGVSGAGCVPEQGGGWASGSSVRRSISARAGSLGEVMPVSRVSIMIRHTNDCSSAVSIEKERFQGGTKPPRVLCLHASRPRCGVRPTRG